MKLKKAIAVYLLIIVVYLIVLLTIDNKHGVFNNFNFAVTQLPALMGLALISFGLRYFRWYWLLKWSGSTCGALSGWWAYLSGFALTATPGKVGELIRIRYFLRLGVSADKVMSAFVFERALDLMVVFLLASLFIANMSMFWLACVFVFLIILVLMLAAGCHQKIQILSILCQQKNWVLLARLLAFFSKALIGCRSWIRLGPMLVSLVLGGVAWSVTAFAFVYLIDQLDIQMPWLAAFSTYPMSMLAGAASMLPGGVGSTEAAIVLQLKWHGVDTSAALLVAVVIRLGTMWFSVFCGFAAILIQEIQFARKAVS